MAQAYLSLERAKSLVEEIVNESPPGTRNPRDDWNTCTYRQDGTNKRCIVGELLHRLGMPEPEIGGFAMDSGYGSGSPYVKKGYMSEKTVDWLGDVQNIFDVGDDTFCGDEKSPTWRHAMVMCRRKGLFS